MFKKNLNYEIKKKTVRDTDGRVIILDLIVNDLRFTLCNIYGLNENAPTFFSKLFNDVNEIGNECKIIGGDFNVVLNVKLDKKGGNLTTYEQSRLEILDNMDKYTMYGVA